MKKAVYRLLADGIGIELGEQIFCDFGEQQKL
jgi:hypothetical protein